MRSCAMARTRILIQAGHQPPLQPGHEDETGAEGERELVVRIQKALVRLLRADDRFEPVPMPGRITDGVDVDAALFLHADGVDEPGPRGFSFGFPDFAVNRRLANLSAAEFERIPDHPPRRDDNITSDRAQYYGFGHVETPGPEVLVEHGFVSNPTEHRWLLRNVEALARAQHVALCRFFGVRPPDAVPPPPVPGALRPRSPLLGPPSAPPRRAIAHLLALEHGGYSDDDVRTLVRQYHRTCRAAGIDALVAVAQMTLETGHLTSFWSQRPRRNLAGIGVTGEEGVGLSFPTLRAARARPRRPAPRVRAPGRHRARCAGAPRLRGARRAPAARRAARRRPDARRPRRPLGGRPRLRREDRADRERDPPRGLSRAARRVLPSCTAPRG